MSGVWAALILHGIEVHEERSAASAAGFWRQLAEGLRFVARTRVLVTLAVLMAVWQMAHYAALVVQILVATRTLGLSEQTVGLCYMGMGVGTIAGSVWGRRISHRIGPGPCLVLGYAVTGLAWLLPALAPANALGVAAFAAMMALFTMGAVFIFIYFLALRQAVTPEPLLGRMTATMPWLTLLAAPGGSPAGGWLGEHLGLRAALGAAAGTSLLLALVAWRLPLIRSLTALPAPSPVPAPGLDEVESEWTALRRRLNSV